MHNGRGMNEMDNPCRRNDCHLCCSETRMTLTEAEVARLEAAGFSGFVRENRNGDLELVNRNGWCVFLDDRSCKIYDLRPDGCRLYPLVLDVGSGRVVLDEFCPHRVEFPIGADDVVELRRSVATERANAATRRRRADG